MGNRKGIVIMLIGLLLMAAALYRVMENDRDEAEAARESDQILAELQSIMWENTQTVGRGENSAYSANVGVGNPLGGETTVVVKTPAPVGYADAEHEWKHVYRNFGSSIKRPYSSRHVRMVLSQSEKGAVPLYGNSL